MRHPLFCALTPKYATIKRTARLAAHGKPRPDAASSLKKKYSNFLTVILD